MGGCNGPASANAFREFAGFASALYIGLRVGWNAAGSFNPKGVV